MLFQTRRGVYCSVKNAFIAAKGTGHCRKHPHGFLNGVRIGGFRRGIRSKVIPHVMGSDVVQSPTCSCCTDVVATLTLLVPAS